MSEEKIETPETKPEVKDEETNVISDNVALLKSEIILLKKLNDELTIKFDALLVEYKQAKEFVDADAKADLIAYIAPKVKTPKEILMLKTKDALKQIKAVLDISEPQTIRSGTPVMRKDKTTPRAKLNSKYDDYMADKYGDKKQ